MKRVYGKKRCHIIFEENKKKKLQEHQKNYREAKKHAPQIQIFQ